MVFIMDNFEGKEKSFNPEEKSFKLGMIEAFCEVVAQEIKPLALSPIMNKEQWDTIRPAVEAVSSKYNVKSYTETNFMPSDFVADEALMEKIVILFYKQEKILQSYFDLKLETERLRSSGLYDEAQRKNTSIALRRLLGYSENAITEHYCAKGR